MKNYLTLFIMIFIFISCEDQAKDITPLLGGDLFKDEQENETPRTEPYEDIEEISLGRESIYYDLQNICACKAGKSISVGVNCEVQCESKPFDDEPILYFELGENENLTTSSYNDLHTFCSTQEGEVVNVGCEVNLVSETGEVNRIEFNPSEGQTEFSVDISHLEENMGYRMSIFEQGFDHHSSFSGLLLGPQSLIRPVSLVDIDLKTLRGKGQFTLLNHTDPWFYDLDGDGYRDIENKIKELWRKYGVSGIDDVDYMFPSLEKIHPKSGDREYLGFFLNSFIDMNTYKSFCPTQIHSANPVIKPLLKLLGETEPLYLLRKKKSCNVILQSLSEIDGAIFVKEKGKKKLYSPGEDDDETKYVFYPVNKMNPLKKERKQKRYELIRYIDYINQCGSKVSKKLVKIEATYVGGGLRQHDERIGCIPKHEVSIDGL